MVRMLTIDLGDSARKPRTFPGQDEISAEVTLLGLEGASPSPARRLQLHGNPCWGRFLGQGGVFQQNVDPDPGLQSTWAAFDLLNS